MLIGKRLEEQEIKLILRDIKENKKLKNLIEEMNYKQKFEFNPQEVKVIQAIEFDAKKEEDVVTAKSIYFEVTNNVKIRYITRYRNNDLSTQNDFIVGEYYNEDNDEVTLNNYTARSENYIKFSESTFDQELIALYKEKNDKEESEFPFYQDYVPGMLNGDVEANGVFDGCLAGGYIWCGQACGGSSACTSTKKGINGLDNCCKTHDCCYTKRGVSYPNCYCDQRLCDCAQAAGKTFNTPVVEAVMCFVC